MLRQQVSAQAESHKEKQSLLREQLTAAKEQRVELLHRQSARRIRNRAVCRGWMAWLERWQAKVYALQRLQEVAAHLHNPDLARPFYHWVRTWQEESYASQQRKQKGELQSYIELMCKQFARRLMQQDLAHAWSTWRESWHAKVYALAKLRHAANHFATPDLAAGFDCWIEFVEARHRLSEQMSQAQRESQLEGSRSDLETELHRVRADYEQKLVAAEEGKLLALERQRLELTGSAAEVAALREQDEREQRVVQLTRRWVRRLMQRDLSQAWSSWQALWEARAYAFQKLRHAGKHLAKPGLAMGFDGWLAYLDDRREQHVQRKGIGLQAERDAIAQELQYVRTEYEQKLSTLEAERTMLLEKVGLLGGAAAAADAQMQARLVAERDDHRRVLCSKITRRMMNRAISRGWTAWADMVESRAYARQKMAEVAGRLHKPQLARAFYAWISDWNGAKAEAKEREIGDRINKETQSMEKQLSEAKFEASQLELQRLAHEDEIKALKEKLQTTADALKSRDQSLMGAMEAKRELAALQEHLKSTRAAAQTADEWRGEAEDELARQRKANQELLENLLADQRQSFHAELEQLQREVELHKLQRSQLQHDMSSLTEQHVKEYEGQRELLKCAHMELHEVSELKQSMEKQLDELGQRLSAQTESRGAAETELARLRAEKLRVEAALREELEKMQAEAARHQKVLRDEAAALQLHVLRLEKERTASTSSSPPKKEKSTRRSGKGPLGNIDLDEGPDAPPISEQIKAALKANAGKVLDLFRSWDADGDGLVTRAEFHRAMTELGLEVPRSSIDDLFSQWDKDGGGSLGLKELTKILRAAPEGSKSKTASNSSPSVGGAAKAVRAVKLLNSK